MTKACARLGNTVPIAVRVVDNSLTGVRNGSVQESAVRARLDPSPGCWRSISTTAADHNCAEVGWRGQTAHRGTQCVETSINGINDSSIGTIYLPWAQLDFQGNAEPAAGDFMTGMVVDDIGLEN